MKKGYELDRTYYCDTCGERHVFKTGPSDNKDQPKKQGQQMRTINKIMSIALFTAGTPQQQMLEIFHEAGIVSPSKKGQAKMLDKVYEEAKQVSLEQLKKNRFKHVKACQEVENYSGDHKFTDKNGISHSFAVGPISTDGNGEKRAYGHVITGQLQSSVLKC